MKQAALFDDTLVFVEDGNIRIPIREAALMELAMMEYIFDGMMCIDIKKTIEYQKQKLLVNKGRYAVRALASKEAVLSCANYSDYALITG